MTITNMKSTTQTISKTDFINNMRDEIKNGGEITWVSTENDSFEWSEINASVKKFLTGLGKTLNSRTIDVGIFYPQTKETIYKSYNIRL